MWLIWWVHLHLVWPSTKEIPPPPPHACFMGHLPLAELICTPLHVTCLSRSTQWGCSISDSHCCQHMGAAHPDPPPGVRAGGGTTYAVVCIQETVDPQSMLLQSCSDILWHERSYATSQWGQWGTWVLGSCMHVYSWIPYLLDLTRIFSTPPPPRVTLAHLLEFHPSHSLRVTPAHLLEFYPSHSPRVTPAHLLEFYPFHSPRVTPAHLLEFYPFHSPRVTLAHLLKFYPSHSPRVTPAHLLEFTPPTPLG